MDVFVKRFLPSILVNNKIFIPMIDTPELFTKERVAAMDLPMFKK